MKQILSCPLCHEKVYSDLGKGCKMCGMLLKDKSKEFCSEICRREYKKVHRLIKSKRLNKSGGKNEK